MELSLLGCVVYNRFFAIVPVAQYLYTGYCILCNFCIAPGVTSRSQVMDGNIVLSSITKSGIDVVRLENGEPQSIRYKIAF